MLTNEVCSVYIHDHSAYERPEDVVSDYRLFDMHLDDLCDAILGDMDGDNLEFYECQLSDDDNDIQIECHKITYSDGGRDSSEHRRQYFIRRNNGVEFTQEECDEFQATYFNF
jgi:hypothetical protein